MHRILIFSLNYYPRFIGGAEVAIKAHTDRMPDFEFDMITLQFDRALPKVEKIGNITVYRIGFSSVNPTIADVGHFPLSLNKFLYPFLAFFKAHSLHKDRQYDIVWGMMARYAGLAALFFKWANSKVRFVLSLQEGDIEGDPVAYLRRRAIYIFSPLFASIYRTADAVAAESNFLGEVARAMGFRGEPELIPNGVDVAIFIREYPRPELEALQQKLGKGPNDKFIITTSRLVKKNAVDDVIKALKFLPNGVKFLVLGIGPDLEALRALAKTEGVGARVLFLGHIEHREMPKYLKISEIFIRPSLSEGMGNSFIEAMASGIPIIGTNVGGIPDFLKDGETGLFCEVRNPKSIAEKVEKLLSDQSLREKIIANAKKLAVSEYNWDLLAQKMRDLLR